VVTDSSTQTQGKSAFRILVIQMQVFDGGEGVEVVIAHDVRSLNGDFWGCKIRWTHPTKYD
jgi:hypothetical protein